MSTPPATSLGNGRSQASQLEAESGYVATVGLASATGPVEVGGCASMGADAIEFDVQATSDGHLVVIHDISLERTTNGSGPVFAARFEEISTLDAGAWFGPVDAGEHVPALSDVLALRRHGPSRQAGGRF